MCTFVSSMFFKQKKTIANIFESCDDEYIFFLFQLNSKKQYNILFEQQPLL